MRIFYTIDDILQAFSPLENTKGYIHVFRSESEGLGYFYYAVESIYTAPVLLLKLDEAMPNDKDYTYDRYYLTIWKQI